MSGFQFKETMSGTYTRDGGEPHPIHFTARARVGSLFKYFGDRKADLDGELTMEGLATDRPMHGEITLDPVLGRLIRYEFSFDGDDGKHYHFLGQKDVTLLDPIGSMTTLPAAITDDHGAHIASATLHFDFRDLPSFLGSFRPIL